VNEFIIAPATGRTRRRTDSTRTDSTRTDSTPGARRLDALAAGNFFLAQKILYQDQGGAANGGNFAQHWGISRACASSTLNLMAAR
jgi:hypothetical protein